MARYVLVKRLEYLFREIKNLNMLINNFNFGKFICLINQELFIFTANEQV